MDAGRTHEAREEERQTLSSIGHSMKSGFLLALVFLPVYLLPSGVLAQQSGQAVAQEQCEFPVMKPKEADRPIKINKQPLPKLSTEEWRQVVEKRMVLRALFCGSGKVVNIRVERGISESIDAKFIEAARKIRFTPGEKDGKKVSHELLLEYGEVPPHLRS
jgi:hypothetical protein